MYGSIDEVQYINHCSIVECLLFFRHGAADFPDEGQGNRGDLS